MENASKALIMAGSILIAIIVISVLVMAYGNLTETMNAKDDEDAVEQVMEFNKQYDVYYRDNLYGSDILSITNKVADYNERQSKEQGYEKLDIEVKFKTGIDGPDREKIIDKTITYKSGMLKEKVQDLEGTINSYKSIRKGKQEEKLGKTIAALSGLRTNELEKLFDEKDMQDESRKGEIKSDIKKYLSYNAALTTLKSRKFKATKFEYDEKTKRIKTMKFSEIWN